jgi:hypothetical protein
MAPDHDSPAITLESTRHGLATLISTTLALSFGISIAAAAIVLAAGMWLEQ